MRPVKTLLAGSPAFSVMFTQRKLLPLSSETATPELLKQTNSRLPT
jgi:hypothetical protein